jgi:phosphoglycolate phosphatase
VRQTVGFDLDMTLIDSRPGIAAAYRELVTRTGVSIDVDLVVSRLGPPLEHEMANWFPAEEIPRVIQIYRDLYPAYAITPTIALPGAEEAIQAVRDAGADVIVVTAKRADLARLHLAHLGLDVADVIGLVWSGGKARPLREYGAVCFIGDHVADMTAAREAGIVGVGVTTGPCDAAELGAAGAEVVLPTLLSFPQLLLSGGGLAGIGVGR